MELCNQIKKHRTQLSLSQEELAEKVYVTRQTISNWENNKNYPDIHSLLLLSSVFDISLDQLIKGDINNMKEEISKTEQKKIYRLSIVFSLLLILSVVSVAPLMVFLGFYGMMIYAVLFVITMYFALKVEKYKKQYDIQTYKEIVAFMEGQRLDSITKDKEAGKRLSQKILYALGSALIGFTVSIIFVWLLKLYIF